MPIFRWIYPKIMGKGQFFGALRAHKMLILLNFAQKSLSCNPPPLGHSEEYSPMACWVWKRLISQLCWQHAKINSPTKNPNEPNQVGY